MQFLSCYVWAASVDGLVANLAARHCIYLQCDVM